MPAQSPTKPVTDTVAKVNNDVAVGSDLAFQRRWWKFEIGVWTAFTILIVLALIGFLGRGPWAHKQVRTADGSLQLQYERVARFGTASVLTIKPGPDAARGGRLQLWASGDLIQSLGAQRVEPQPTESTLTGGGVLYTFPVGAWPWTIQISLQPRSPGVQRVYLRVPGHEQAELHIFVMP